MSHENSPPMSPQELAQLGRCRSIVRNNWRNVRSNVRRTLGEIGENVNESEMETEGLGEEILGKLIVATYNETEDLVLSAVGQTYKCVICFDEYSLGKLISQLPCKHIFCKDCIFYWLKKSSTCPLCREDVKRHFTCT